MGHLKHYLINFFYYTKFNSRKRPSKFEGIVFAKDEKRVKELKYELISGLPIEIEYMSICGTEISLENIYEDRPELIGITPEEGYIYLRSYHFNNFREYSGVQ